MEVVLPRLARVITLWEFLLMKVEKEDQPQPPVDDMLKEYATLHKKVGYDYNNLVLEGQD